MKKSLIYFGITFAAAGILLLLSRMSADFAEFFALNIYPLFSVPISFLTGLLPFSLIEILICLLVLGVLVGLTAFVVLLIKRKGKRKKVLKCALSVLLIAAGTISFCFTVTMGVNYSRKEFYTYSGLEITSYTKEDLQSVLNVLIGELNELIPQMDYDENGIAKSGCDIAAEAQSAMTLLSAEYKTLERYYPRPKAMLFSELMSYYQLTGVTWGFTMESNYNNNVPEWEKPYTVCHELSHLNGFMREDEANFIAFLACTGSDNLYFRYSGIEMMITRCYNEYIKTSSSEEIIALQAEIPQELWQEWKINNEYWKKYETPVAEIATKVNDTFLKLNDQSDGVASYNRVVELVIALFKSEGKIS